MARDPRYDILFEPVPIGPVTARNRFYQVPHCNGMGYLRPRMAAAMRAMKAEGGWAVVNTEYCSIHPSSDDTPYPHSALWSTADIEANALMTEAVHARGALAGVELWYGGRSANLLSREAPLGVGHGGGYGLDPVQCRAMDGDDIATFRQWHVEAARRAREADFDVVYVYAAHGYLLSDFLSPGINHRTDKYGGSIENRARLVREIITDTREAVGDRCAVAVRISAGNPDDFDEDRLALIEHLAELPDLWDVTIDDYDVEMGSSRFVRQGTSEALLTRVRSLTTKPVVSVGRFTSPDAMASCVRRGVLDLIGAARPSIADPFLPRKIEAGRVDDIRECIGCNVCYASDFRGAPIRCTQNPTMGEEWRLGWHPERIAKAASRARVLVVGAGPAGLECTRALAHRGYSTTLAEASTAPGGRVAIESALPGLAEWGRVRDHRLQQLDRLAAAELYLDSHMGVEAIIEFGADHVVLATGARWRDDGVGRRHSSPIGITAPRDRVLTPDDIAAGVEPDGSILVYDDDHYYMGAVVAERLRTIGREVTLATPGNVIAGWSVNTQEHHRTMRRLLELGVHLVRAHELLAFDDRGATLGCVHTGREVRHAADAIVLVTTRVPNDRLFEALRAREADLREAGIGTPVRIGDCHAPGTIAAAVYSGHRYARELDAPEADDARRRRDSVMI